MRIRVKCHPGRRGEAVPDVLQMDDRSVRVAEVVDQWWGPGYRYIKVRDEEGNVYVVHLAESEGQWTLRMFQSPKGQAIGSSAPTRKSGYLSS